MKPRDPRSTFRRFETLSNVLSLELGEHPEPNVQAAWGRILDHADAIRHDLDLLERHLKSQFAAGGDEPAPVVIDHQSIEAATVRIVTERPEFLKAWYWTLFASPTMAALMADATIPSAEELAALTGYSNVARVLVPDCHQQDSGAIDA